MPTKQEKEVVVPETCTWEIRDFSKLKAVDKFYSQEFDVAGHKWYPFKTLFIFTDENPSFFFFG